MSICANSYATDDERWKAVEDRSPEADGIFVYGVVTTGVYCRPSCPSRSARRENVKFYTLHAEAEKAGLRPCLRCRPKERSLLQRHVEKVEEACRIIEESERPLSLHELSARIGMAPHHFHRIFKKIAGVTPKAYECSHRGVRLRGALRDSSSVAEAVYAAGLSSTSGFHAAVDQSIAMKPSAFRAGGAGEAIEFAVADCSLGRVLVAMTPRGVCAIRLGDNDEELLEELRGSFPEARLVPAQTHSLSLVRKAVAHIEEPSGALDLPLDIRGTAFQRRVWQQLQAIPPGETRSYAEVAQALGQPEATRAVAGACAANPVAVVVPCHRVIRSDGSLSGYRWGEDRKRAILKRESRSA